MGKFYINEKIVEVIQLALLLMENHSVAHFKFSFTRDSSVKGLCTDDTIKINYEYALNGDISEIKNTILHEIAHAIAGNENNHNEYWQAIAKELGVKYKKITQRH